MKTEYLDVATSLPKFCFPFVSCRVGNQLIPAYVNQLISIYMPWVRCYSGHFEDIASFDINNKLSE